MKDVFAHFESLGANCEFGFVQRHAGLEPSSLLRWAMVVRPQSLIDALDGDFAGLYAFENLAPYNSEMVIDSRYRIAFHSALRSTRTGDTLAFNDDEADRRDIHRFEAAKIADQVTATRAALVSAARIFVFRKFHGDITRAEIDGLLAALRRHGPARLLIVSLATPSDPPGAVAGLAPGLLHGRIDRFAPGDRAHDVSMAVWTDICRKALELAPPR